MDDLNDLVKQNLSYIKDILSNDYVLTIPAFQRPYVWKTKQVQTLLDDLLTYIGDDEITFENPTPYFLGTVILNNENKSEVEIIDGQQRFITLTIFLAVLRTFLPHQEAQQLSHYLYKEDSASPIGRPQYYRIRLHDQDERFFRYYIQDVGGIDHLRTLDRHVLIGSQKNIYENALLCLKTLEAQPLKKVFHLAKVLLNRCFIAVIFISNRQEASRLFAVLNTSGISLTKADLLKTNLIEKIPKEKQIEYAEKWEKTEAKLGRDTFETMLSQLRFIFRDVEQQNQLLQNLFEALRPAVQSLQSMNKSYLSYAEAFYTIKNASFEHNTNLNALLTWLNRFKNSDWIPATILFLTRNYNNSDALERFFTYLERLIAGLTLQNFSPKKLVERYRQLIIWIEEGDDIYLPQSPLQLTLKEQQDILAILNGDLYLRPEICLYVLMRLDATLSEGEANYKRSIITIEHVLPQNPIPNSVWTHWFPDEAQRKLYVHRLGNLVLLSKKKNSQAQNYDFVIKKQKYFSTDKGVSPFAITSQVLKENEWTPALLEQRQTELLKILKRIWYLS